MHQNILLFIKINIFTPKVSHPILYHLAIHKDTRIISYILWNITYINIFDVLWNNKMLKIGIMVEKKSQQNPNICEIAIFRQ
jgi:hypothetical protein